MEKGRPIEGNVVDVIAGDIFPGRIRHENGVITTVERISGRLEGFLLPGLIDAHIHVDSSLLCPSRFAEAVVPRGTTAVVTDPHEIANVLGMRGVRYMREDAAGVPLRVFLTAPSCVPATSFETSGAALGPAEISSLLREDDVVALGEVMNYEGAIAGDPDVTAKIGRARDSGKPIDGHAPRLTGKRLKDYVRLGISTDHECTTADEAAEKHSLGMKIMVRQGSAARNLPALAPFARTRDFFLVSDDKLASDLLSGHLDRTLAEAVALGIDPLHAVRAATIRPADHYRLPLGAIVRGRLADVVRVADMSTFAVEEVYIGGKLAAKAGAPTFAARPSTLSCAIDVRPRRGEDFGVPAPGGGRDVRVRVIRVIRDEIVTGSDTAVLPVASGRVLPAPARDVLLVAVVNRYREAPPARGFVSGFGLRVGAIASSVAHDSHNIIAVGASADDVADAVNALIRSSGGLCVSSGGESFVLPLPVAGLMSADPPDEVARRHALLCEEARTLGCTLDRPFMTLSFLSLLVIPQLKIGDRGLFDVDRFRFVDAVESEAA